MFVWLGSKPQMRNKTLSHTPSMTMFEVQMYFPKNLISASFGKNSPSPNTLKMNYKEREQERRWHTKTSANEQKHC